MPTINPLKGGIQLEREQKTNRKVRSDKKHSIAPYVPDTYRVWIHRLARHLEISEGEVGVLLIDFSLQSEECLRFFSPYFKRAYTHGNQLFLGHDFAEPINSYIEIIGNRDRFKIRVKKPLYDLISEFQIALGTSYLSHATLALLRYGLHTRNIVSQIAPNFNYEDLFINAPAPRPHTHLSITDLAYPKVKLDRMKEGKNSLVTRNENQNDVYVDKNEKRNVWSILK